MIINALHFKDKNKKFLGIMSALMVGCHLYFSIGSSFIRTPMTEFGAPFITIYGLGYCVLPVILYFWLEFSERGQTLKNIGSIFKELFTWFSWDEFNDELELFNETNLEPKYARRYYMTNRLFIISGPSGVGKNTIFREAQRYIPYIRKTVSDTTRDMRDEEKNEVDYNFITRKEFEKNIQDGKYIEYKLYDNNYYGTPFDEIEKNFISPATALIIDVDGAKNIKRQYPNAISIFIAPPSIEELMQRIKNRGDNTPEEIENRIKIAENELSEAWGFDYIIVNDNLYKSVKDLYSIIRRYVTGEVKCED